MDGVWSSVVFGLSVSNILLGLVILYVFVIFRSLFSRFVIAAAKRLVKKSRTSVDDLILDSIEGPLKLLPIIMGVFLVARLSLDLMLIPPQPGR